MRVAPEMATLAEERLQYWSQLRQLAGLQVSAAQRNLVEGELETAFDAKVTAMRAEYEARIAELRRDLPQQIARRLAEGLMRTNGSAAINELLSTLPAAPASASASGNGASAAPAAPAAAPAPTPAKAEVAAVAAAAPAAATVASPAAATAVADDDGPLALEAYIDSARCTSCNECINLNKKLFAYNATKQAEVKDASAGTFQQLVLAAERCPVSIIHPGSPLNAKEKDVEKWVKRAARFN